VMRELSVWSECEAAATLLGIETSAPSDACV
jgi:hypothetical protein